MHTDFVYLDEAVPGLLWDAKYATSDNFTGAPVDGYFANRVVGTRALAEALNKAMALARAQGCTLLVWDAYRPARAVRRFLQWAGEPENFRTKDAHYPNLQKTDIVPLGYVATESSHSRGSAVDLTLADARTHNPIGMGGGFDLMDEASHHSARQPEEVRENRARLKAIMMQCGFAPYENEWWHYRLKNEPYPDTYFDFPIE